MDSMQNMIRMGGATPNARTDSNNTFSPSQYRARQRSGLAKNASLTPFACFDSMTKSASPAAAVAKGVPGIAGWLRRMFHQGGRALKNSTSAAKERAGLDAALASSSVHADQATIAAARNSVGQLRTGLGKGMQAAGKAIGDSPGLQKGINIGVPVVGGGAALYGSNRMGHSSGLDEGLDKGYNTGVDYGIQAAQQNAPQDPGILGRIMDVFRGQAEQPSAASLQALLEQNKASILARLRQTI